MKADIFKRILKLPLGWSLRSERNRLDLALRTWLCRELRPFIEQSEPKTALAQELSTPELRQKLTDLTGRYDLSVAETHASRQRYLEILTYLDWLDCFYQCEPQAFNRLFQAKEPFRWLDVGAKNWAYADALHAFTANHLGTNEGRIEGVELDAYRRYPDLCTRKQAADAYIQNLVGMHYHAQDVLTWTQPVQIISHFLPFIFEDPLLAWGLPLNDFQPAAILQHLLNLLEPGGMMLIINQGEAEAREQGRLIEAVGFSSVKVLWNGSLPTSFLSYRYPRFGWLLVKDVAD
jgi:hypothetical protein